MISQERRGDYLGKTVQMVPHATDMVQKWIEEVASIPVDGTGAVPDVCLVGVRNHIVFGRLSLFEEGVNKRLV